MLKEMQKTGTKKAHLLINEAEHEMFPRLPISYVSYVSYVPSPELRAYKSEPSLMEWLAKLGSSGAFISGAEHRTCSAGNRTRMSDLPGTPPSCTKPLEP